MERAYKMNGQLDCIACELREGCTQVVPGTGSIFARLAFVGEAPGHEEDSAGEPFVGLAGRVLASLLAFLEAPRSAVYITNTVKCRPVEKGGRNGKPTNKQIAACEPWLMTELSLVQPRIIVALGAYALEACTKLKCNVISAPAEKFAQSGKTMGARYREWGKVPIVPFFHPAALTYPNSGPKKATWKKASAVLKKMCQQLMYDEAIDTQIDPSLV